MASAHANTRVAPDGPAPSLKHGRPLMTDHTLYVGLDTDKLHIDVAVAEPLPGGEVRYVGQIANDTTSLDRVLKRLRKGGRALVVCYEAGPCGAACPCEDGGPVAPSRRPAGGELPGDRAVADPAPTGGSGKNQPARQHHPGQAAAGRRADRDLGTGRGARGDARYGARAGHGGCRSDALPSAHRRFPAAPGDWLHGQAVDQDASRCAAIA